MLRHDYSLSERALGLWSSVTLALLAVTSQALRYVMPSISCWMPNQFTGAMVRYANDVCFHRSLVDLLVFDHVGPGDGPALHRVAHQWVPFALGVGAVLCLLPHLLWRALGGLLWLDAHSLAETLLDNQRRHAPSRHVMLKDSALLLQAGLGGGGGGGGGRGSWMLTAAAVGRKGLVVAVCVLQAVLVAVLFRPQLGADEHRLNNASTLLPEYLCDFSIRLISNVQRYTLQCTLPIVQVYSRGFTFLFYFFLLLAVGSLLDTLVFLGRVAIPGLRDASLKRYLAVSHPEVDLQHIVQRFLDSLGADGRLILAVTADACGPLAAADLTNHLLMAFKSSPRPGAALSDPGYGPHPVTTVPPPGPAPAPAGASPPSAMGGAGSPGDADAIPLIPLQGGGENMK